MTISREAFISKVAEVLGVLPSGQTLDAEDYAKLDGEINSAFEEMAAREIFYVTDNREFEEASWLALAALTAALVAPYWAGITQINGMDIPTFEARAESRLKRISASGPKYYVMESEYF